MIHIVIFVFIPIAQLPFMVTSLCYTYHHEKGIQSHGYISSYVVCYRQAVGCIHSKNLTLYVAVAFTCALINDFSKLGHIFRDHVFHIFKQPAISDTLENKTRELILALQT